MCTVYSYKGRLNLMSDSILLIAAISRRLDSKGNARVNRKPDESQ